MTAHMSGAGVCHLSKAQAGSLAQEDVSVFSGTVGTAKGRWELRSYSEGGAASRGDGGHAASWAGSQEGQEAGGRAALQGRVRPGSSGRALPLAAAPVPRERPEPQAASITMTWLEGGGQGPLATVISLCSLWALLSFPWPNGPEEEQDRGSRGNPAAGCTHPGLATLLRPLQPVPPHPR